LSYRPSDWNIYSNRGDCYKGLNNLLNALEDYLKAFEIEKKNECLNYKISHIYNLRGISLFNSKNY
jgi:tetratricopeptide (TPR) repeat protein